MGSDKSDINADTVSVIDRKEPVRLMEPMVLSDAPRHRPQLTDLAVNLAARSSGFHRSLPDGLVTVLADLVRAMNCYYSNLIEGHDTHPVDIEKALKNDYSTSLEKRNLQLEAKAHIEVQQWIDRGGLQGNEVSLEGLCEIHRRFYENLPDELLWVEEPDTGEKLPVVPGELRQRDAKVGRHIPISPGALPRFMERFAQVYGRVGKAEKIISSAAAHHRFVWIHPFPDGNGRVARLMSHATLLDALDTGGIWSIARGLARNDAEYKRHLIACDLTRRNDLDGRGNLSEEALASFSHFFLQTCIDQISFMEKLVRPDQLRTRILLWADEEIAFGHLPKDAKKILQALLYRGSLPRSAIAEILGKSTRQARRVTESLTEHGIIASSGLREPWRLVFSASLASRWMPGLFPDIAV